ncbi:M20/M25/M40 family metallo-hydrolase [Nitrospina watsonii]|uniref:D-alanine--D-alanine ligase n=1 Tax=Nitrospina watsonii TaxID=1323948 RepID=A0ABM9HEF4_9BACT|nr:M20/M25/M40 family metallo-hydrolase [Nitrospina watsonii]CAI2718606.1 putative D-alanine--D-alanine ligase [Nitrospina watsonii]
MKVAVIYNKNQSEVINVFGAQNREIYNPKTVERVASSLEKGGHNVRVIDGNIHLIEKLNEFMPKVMHGEQPGMVFNMAYGIQGVSRYTHVPALLEMVGIAYVGSSPAGHGIALDKITSKVLFQANGVATPRYWSFFSEDQIPADIPFPVIVKPKMEAVSMGIEVVHDIERLRETVKTLVKEYNQQVLVEEFIPGREFAVGLLGNGDPEALPIVEFDLEGDPNAIQTYTEKMKKPKEKICPAKIDDATAEKIRELTKGAFRALGLFDFCRADFRMDDKGNLYVLELNSMASLGLTGSYVHAAKVAGYTYESLINRMLDVAVERYFGEKEMNEVQEPEPFFKSFIKRQTTSLPVRLRSYLRGNIGTMEDYLAHLVEINSYARNIDGVNSLGKWISNQLGRMGFQREVHTKAEFGNVLYFSNHTDDENDILLIGQLDNPIPNQDYVAYQEDRGKLYGSGVYYGKGGLAILFGAIQALRYTRSLKKVKCGILLISDETAGGRSSKSLIEDLSNKAKYVLGLQGAGLSGEATTSFSGVMKYNVEIKWAPSKLSKTKSEQTDLISFLTQKISALRKMTSKDDGVEVAITSVNTQGLDEATPDFANLTFRIRFRSPDLSQQLKDQIYKTFEVSATNPIKVNISRSLLRLPLMQSEATGKFYQSVEKIAKNLEIRIQKQHGTASTSLCYVSPDKPVLGNMGPISGGMGTRNEYVVRDSLLDRSVLLAYLIYLAANDFKE